MPGSLKRAALIAGGATAVALTAATLLMPVAQAASPDTGTTVAFHDDFDGTSLDLSKWQFINGTGYPGGPDNYGTGEGEYNRPDNTSVHDGKLYITLEQDHQGRVTSSRIESRKTDFKPNPGQVMDVSARIALPDVHGPAASKYWPAFWMYGSALQQNRWLWPGVGEFDIAETVSGEPWTNGGVIHCGFAAQWGGPCNEPTGLTAGRVPLADAWGGFHTYSFRWDRTGAEDVLSFATDGRTTYTVKRSQIPDGPWATMTANGYNLVANVAWGGAYPDAVGLNANTTEFGHPMVIDNVNVQYSGTTTQQTTTPATTSASASPTTTASSSIPPTVTSPPPPPSTPPSTPPSAEPGAFRAVQVTANRIDLTWPKVPGAAYYRLVRAGVPLPDAVGKTTTTTISDVGLNTHTPYREAIQAVAADGKVLSTTKELTIVTP